MTFKTDAQQDIADIINDTDEFGLECIHTPQGGAAQLPFNCLKGETILHGNEETGVINSESVHITVITTDVTAVKKWDSILLTGTDYEVVNDPYIDSEFSGASVIELKRDRLNKTKI